MLVHKDPQLLCRAMNVLSDGECGFFIHVDRKAEIAQFGAASGQSIEFCDQRVPVYWGEFSQIEATLLLIKKALSSSTAYDYFVFFQGGTYPLRTGRYIQRFLQTNNDREFINLVRMPAPGYPLSKINELRYPSTMQVHRLAARVAGKFGLARRDYRRHLRGLDAYSGDAYWVLSRKAVQHIIEFDRNNPHVAAFFRNTLTSDEMFFQTILGNSPFRSQVRRSLVYLDWPKNGNHPAMLSDFHVRNFELQERVLVDNEWGLGEMLFARKLSDGRLDLLDRIDEMIRRKEGIREVGETPNSIDHGAA